MPHSAYKTPLTGAQEPKPNPSISNSIIINVLHCGKPKNGKQKVSPFLRKSPWKTRTAHKLDPTTGTKATPAIIRTPYLFPVFHNQFRLSIKRPSGHMKPAATPTRPPRVRPAPHQHHTAPCFTSPQETQNPDPRRTQSQQPKGLLRNENFQTNLRTVENK